MAVALKERTAENDTGRESERERESELFGQVIQPDLVGAASGLWLACRRFDVDPDDFRLPSIGWYCYRRLPLLRSKRPEVEASNKMPKAPYSRFLA